MISLEMTAFIGRLVGLLDSGRRLDGPCQRARAGPLACALGGVDFPRASALGSLSGEWLVGGIEAKVVAYGLLFSAIATAIEGQDAGNGRRILLGRRPGGTGHQLPSGRRHLGRGVGPVFATLVRTLFRRNRAKGRRVGGRWYAASMAALIVLAVPGIVAGLRAASGSSVVADYIQVYYRLAHHLDPLHFAEWAWIGDGLNWILALIHLRPLDFTGWPWVAYGLLVCFWLCGRRWMSRREPERWFFWFVVGSGLIALGGFLVGWRSGPPEHVQNYLIPWKGPRLSVAVEAAQALSVPSVRRSVADCRLDYGRRIRAGIGANTHARSRSTRGRSRRTVIWIWLLCGTPALVACLFRAPDARSPFTPTERADWLDACSWVEHNTPADALILTPTQQTWAFKWYAQRAEYVSYKDCPQDGPGHRRVEQAAALSGRLVGPPCGDRIHRRRHGTAPRGAFRTSSTWASARFTFRRSITTARFGCTASTTCRLRECAEEWQAASVPLLVGYAASVPVKEM